MERQVYNVVRPREGENGKTYWDQHGVMVIREGRISLHLASIPTGEWDGWFHVYAREERKGNGKSQTQQPEGQDRPPVHLDDDIPF